MRGSCALCEHWKKPDPKAGVTAAGNCHRGPPTPFMLPIDTPKGPAMTIQSHFPPTAAGETCGEFKKLLVIVAD